MRHDPFRDEVAIDFPSAGHFVERVRQAFLSDSACEHLDSLNAEVSVSRDEAHRGTISRLRLAFRCTCGLCGGRGEIWSERCIACDGTGDSLVRYYLRLPVPPGVVDGARFQFRVRPPDAAPVRVQVRVRVTSSRDVRM